MAALAAVVGRTVAAPPWRQAGAGLEAVAEAEVVMIKMRLAEEDLLINLLVVDQVIVRPVANLSLVL